MSLAPMDRSFIVEDGLLLQKGEYIFLIEHRVEHVFLTDATKNAGAGRLVLGSRSLMFIPQKLGIPAMLFPLRSVTPTDSKTKKSAGKSAKSTMPGKSPLFVNFSATGGESNFDGNHIFYVRSEIHEEFDSILQSLLKFAKTPSAGDLDLERALDVFIRSFEERHAFDASTLQMGETIRKKWTCHQITKNVALSGTLVLTTKKCIFERFIPEAPWIELPLASILRVFPVDFLQRDTSFEIFMYDGSSLFCTVESKSIRDEIVRTLIDSSPNVSKKSIHDFTQMWITGNLTNFEYLTILNQFSGRTNNTISQYPVFPWILANYTSTALDLYSHHTYRDLSKPLGILDAALLPAARASKERKGYHYVNHYSTAEWVSYLLYRPHPLYSVRYGHGTKKTFGDIHELFLQAKNPEKGDISGELIPEFFDGNGSFCVSSGRVNLPPVRLPAWASSRVDFMRKHRLALESAIVTSNLHQWIDLTFGHLQRGDAAEGALNTYHADSTRSLGDTFPRTELRMALINSKQYGRHPRQLFDSPHPRSQLTLGALLSEGSRLKEKLENMKYRVAEMRKELGRRVCVHLICT
eukprot:TRINITY_DN865_c0_g1_i5.p1 TRINITY_DN865_c0_g1~~TRINITY_DN865_c0_g1_i5.p1  ORF type:complete len:580 (-),score=109.66 TRINITY_DN865_c0_g1_i5:662-2401(-)